jgi:hypothetical protein
MKFDEFPLYDALHDIYVEFEAKKQKPRSADWLIYHRKRDHLVSLVQAKLSGFEEEEILKAWDDFGKNKEKYKLLIGVCRKYGSKCFYDGRGIGCCSKIMSVERIPSQRDEELSLQNAVVVCKKHNTDRRS